MKKLEEPLSSRIIDFININLPFGIKIRWGVSRWCLLIGKFAIKFPMVVRLKYFYYGLFANLVEGEFKGHEERYKIPKIYFKGILGFGIISERCSLLTDDEYYSIDKEFFPINRDFQYRNIGKTKDGRIVMVDFAEVYKEN